jgi:tetratricopeptide (TPR) repeat protein
MRLLQLAAVWGRPLELATAGQMLGSVPSGLLQDSVDEAVASGLLERPGNPIGFRHDLVREFVYEAIPETERIALHQLCASCLMADGHGPLEAAPHARLGARRGDRQAVGILREAAAACGAAMPQTAADLLRDAFEGLPEADPLRPAVGEAYADFLAQAQRGADAIAVVDALLSQPHSAEFDARLQALAARALWLMGLPDDMAAAEAALAEGDMLGDQATLVLARQALGEIARNEGRHLAAYEHFHELRTLVGASYLAEEIAALQFIDRFDEADALLLEASRSAEDQPGADLPSLVCAQLWRDFKLGRFDEAVADAQTLLRVGNEIGNYVHRLDAHVVMSTIAVVHGDLRLARELLARAEDEVAADDPVQVPGLLLARARIAAAEGDFGAGLQLLKPLGPGHPCGMTRRCS